MSMTLEQVALGYSVTPRRQFELEGVPYHAYGLSYRGPDGVERLLEDISEDFAVVSKMAELFNLCQLPPDRLAEAVESLLP